MAALGSGSGTTALGSRDGMTGAQLGDGDGTVALGLGDGVAGDRRRGRGGGLGRGGG